jgi:tRNA pseudouridine38-40 synthase
VFVRNVIEARWVDHDDVLAFEITADSFLRHMVRTLVGTMLELPPDRIADLISAPGARADAGTTAPPWGLYLERVYY